MTLIFTVNKWECFERHRFFCGDHRCSPVFAVITGALERSADEKLADNFESLEI